MLPLHSLLRHKSRPNRDVAQLVAHKKFTFLNTLLLFLTSSISALCDFTSFFDISSVWNKSHQNHTKWFPYNISWQRVKHNDGMPSVRCWNLYFSKMVWIWYSNYANFVKHLHFRQILYSIIWKMKKIFVPLHCFTRCVRSEGCKKKGRFSSSSGMVKLK